MKKSINDRCPLQVECERKRCDFTENDEIDIPAFDERSKESPEYALLATAYASFDDERVNYFWWRWDSAKHSMACAYQENESLDFLYKILTELGYEMSDEEKALQDGTHELFQEVDE